MKPALLILNSGSSSLKFRLYGLSATGQSDLPYILGGKVTDIGGTPAFQLHNNETSRDERHTLPSAITHAEALTHILHQLTALSGDWQVTSAAHRIVHGGPDFTHAVRLDADAMRYLRSLEPLAPLHQPHNLKAVEALWAVTPDLVQYGCFDTAFHTGHAPLHSTYALPKSIRDQGVRRYGFHGLSYQWIAEVLKTDHPTLHAGRTIVAHLGNGSSLCALKGGRSIDTTMGFTALEGLPMGTRSGSVDPGAVLYMQQTLGLSPDQIQSVLYDESGLKGLSGISNDVQTLLSSHAPEAAFALDYFAVKTAQHIASLSVSLGGLDGLVFTGGIGEHAAQ
ncbi:MAG: acetate kinase, partial [Asticcacaulis sp.]